ncbi:MAG TPA: hypothetical protein VN043_08195 [Rhodanobacter sp.]|nr:hypothetical protein [Rhodanobacter sp.]
MNEQNEWQRWSELWRQQPSVDIERLRRGARRKLRRMRVAVALELLLTMIAVGQVMRLILDPGVEWRWKAWAGMTLVFMLVVQGLLLHVRRGAWRTAGEEAGDILRLTAKRATAGIRHAKLNAWSALLWLAVTLLVAAPELTPAHWQHDPRLRSMVLLQCAINLPIIALGVGLCAWYIRRQRRRLREVLALLRDYDD